MITFLNYNVSSRLGVYKVYENWRNVQKNKYVCTYTKNAALEGIWTHCVVWCLAAFYGLSLFNFHWIGSAWRFLPPLYSLHSKEVEKSFEFWCPKKNCLEVFQNRYLFITKNSKKQWCEEKISTLKTAPESKPEFVLTAI